MSELVKKEFLNVKPARFMNIKNLPPIASNDKIAVKTNKTTNRACRNAQTTEGGGSLGSSRYLGGLAYHDSCSS